MLSRKLVNICMNKTWNKKYFHTALLLNKQTENPIWRTFRILGEDITSLRKDAKRPELLSREFPRFADIVIIGGGAIGSSIAYWLKEKTSRHGLSVVVIEKDPSYEKCSTARSAGGLRQQFSLPENIQMSCYGAEFIRTLKNRFGPEADVHFKPNGYLVLADEQNATGLMDNFKVQKEFGAVNILLSKDNLKERFPWVDVSDVELGCLGVEKEGWFDPWILLNLFKKGATELGTQYIQGEVTDFLFSERNDIILEGEDVGTYEGLKEVVVKLPNGESKSIHFAYCILAAGCESGKIAELAKIGVGRGMLSVPLPVEKRKRYIYTFDCKEGVPSITPVVIDYTGAFCRRDSLGGLFIGGISPKTLEEEPSVDNLEVDYDFFNEAVWPILAKRVPAFNQIKVTNGWSGYYEFNRFDENGIIGPHPYYPNLYIATGFSGHGIQQSPAVGRAVAELILDGKFQTLDLTRLGFERLMVNKPMYESVII